LNIAVPADIASGNQSISIQVNGVTSPAGTYVPTANPLEYEGSAGLAVVTITPANVSLGVGQSAQLSWQAKQEITGFPLFLSGATAWVSSNPQVALVSAAGEVIGVGPGSATITASEGGYTAKASITITGN
jgi:pullulanase